MLYDVVVVLERLNGPRRLRDHDDDDDDVSGAARFGSSLHESDGSVADRSGRRRLRSSTSNRLHTTPYCNSRLARLRLLHLFPETPSCCFLPPDIQSSSCVSVFHQQLKTYLVSQIFS